MLVRDSGQQGLVGQKGWVPSSFLEEFTGHLSAEETALLSGTCTCLLINPRRACAARVTVLGLSFCLSVTTFSAATRNKTANKRYRRVQCHTGFI